MSFFPKQKWLRTLLDQFRGSAKPTQPRRRMQIGLRLELLEDRLAPAVLTTLASNPIFMPQPDLVEGGGPSGPLVVDSNGDFFGETISSPNGGGPVLFELAAGTSDITAVANVVNGYGPTGQSGLVEDSSGNLYGISSNAGEGSFVFSVPAGSNTINNLAPCNFSSGATGHIGLVDSQGNVFGTTNIGGDYGCGTIFELQAGTNTITTLASFNNNDGDTPDGSLVEDSSGDLFGTTLFGGMYHSGTVFELAAGSNTPTVLASFDQNNGLEPTGLVMDSSGNFFGTTQYGGANQCGTVFEVMAGTEAITTLASFSDTVNPNYYSLSGLVVDSSGNLFGTTEGGGAYQMGTVYEVVAGSGTITPLVSFNGSDGAYPTGGLVLAGNGNLFGTTNNDGAYGGGTVFEISPTAPTVSVSDAGGTYNGSTTFPATATITGTNGEPASTLEGVGLTLDYVRLNADGTTIDLGANAPGAAGNYQVTGSFAGSTTYLPASATTSFLIAKANPTLTTVAGPTVIDGSGVPLTDSATLSGAGVLTGTITFVLYDPSGAVVDTETATVSGPGTYSTPSGFVPSQTKTYRWIAQYDGDNNNNPTNGVLGTTPTNTLQGWISYVLGSQSPSIASLGPLAVNGAGVYVSEFTPQGGGNAINGVAVFAPGSTTFTSFLTVPSNGDLTSLALDHTGNLFVASPADNEIFEFSPGSTTPTAILNGVNEPEDLAVDASNNLFVSNDGNNTVSVFAPGSTTPDATLTGLNTPGPIAFDSFGGVFVVNINGGTISKFVPGSTTPTAVLGGEEEGVSDIATDASGNLFVTSGDRAYGGGSSVYEFAHGSTTPTTVLTGLDGATQVAVDASGNLFVLESGSTVCEFAQGSTTPTALTGLQFPLLDMTLDPQGDLYVTNGWGTGSGVSEYTQEAQDEAVVPFVQSLVGNTQGNPDPHILGNLLTSSSSISYTINFGVPVIGVVSSDFVPAGTITPNSIHVQPACRSDGAAYTVTLCGISGQGTLGLNFVDNGGITALAGNTLPQVIEPVEGQVYTIDTDPPVVQSFVGSTPAISDPNNPGALLTNASSVSYTLTFSEPVTGVNAADFGVSPGFGTPTIQVTPVAGSNGTVYTITVNGITGSGEFNAFFNTLTSITDQNGFAFYLTAAPSVTNFPSSQTYTIDQVPPVVLAITPTTPASPGSLVTSASSVSYAVTFSKLVTGVDPTDFVLTETGTVVATSTQVTVDPNNPNNWIVTISGITGDGTLGLQLANNNHIFDLAGNPLSQSFAPVTLLSLPTISLGQGQSLMAVADVNGDGKDDLIIANSYSDSMSTMLGNGDGTFQAPQPFAVGVAPFNGVVADVNGDGKPDLVMLNSSNGTVSVLLNNGDGTFQSPQTYTTGGDPVAVAVADINGDGKPDLVIANSSPTTHSNGNVSLLLNNGTGTFQSPETLVSSSPSVNPFDPDSVAVGDVNGDGKPDIVVGTSFVNNVYYFVPGQVILLQNDGTGNFPNSQQVGGLGGGGIDVALIDLNGDGKSDIVTANGYGVTCVLNNGDGTFTNPLTLPGGSGVPFGADLTGNGKIDDLVVSNPGSNTVNVFLTVPPVYTIEPAAHIAADPNATQAADKANLMLTATDPLSSQQFAAGFTYAINWGDGALQTVPATANNGSGAPVSHTYTADGSYLVSVTATDVNGEVSSAATGLIVVSSHADDNVAISGAGAGQIAVSVDGGNPNTFSPTDLVLVSGQGGNDTYAVNLGSTLTTPITIQGSGSDSLNVYGSPDPNLSNFIVKDGAAQNITWGTTANQVLESVGYSGIQAIDLNGGAGPNFITDPGSQTTINGGPGANTITITATTGNGVVINGGGSDTYILDLGSLAGPVTINNANAGATDSLVVNGAAGINTITDSGSQVTDDGETINVNAPLTGTTINGGSGANTIVISATTGNGVVINGGPTTNTYVAQLGNLLGPVSIENSNPGASDTLVINAQPNGNAVGVAGNEITQDSQAVVVNAPLADLTVNDGSSNGVGGTPVTVGSLSLPVQSLTLNGNQNNFTVDPSVSQSVAVAYTDVSQSPTASAGGPYVITYGQPLALDGSGSSDPDGNPLTYSWTINGHANAASGVAPVLSAAALQALGIAGGEILVISVEVNNGLGFTATAGTSLTVDPEAIGQTVTVSSKGKVRITLEGSDSQPPKEKLVFMIVSLPADGTLYHGKNLVFAGETFTGAPKLRYVADPGSYGNIDSFTFTVTDHLGLVGQPGTVSIDLPPLGVAQSTSVTEHGQAQITLAGTDASTAAGNLVFTVASLPTEGTLYNGTSAVQAGETFNGPPALTYLPESGYANTTDSFTFAVTDSFGLTSNPASVTIAIKAATPTVTVSGGPFTYDGTPHAAMITATGVGGVSVSGTFDITYNGSHTVPTNAGAYNVVVKFTSGDSDYTNATGSGTLSIDPATPTLNINGGPFTYDGNAHAATVTAHGVNGGNVKGSFSVTYTSNGSPTLAPTDAGTYGVEAIFTSNDANYLSVTVPVSGSISIDPASPKLKVTGGTFTYDGTAHAATATATGVGGASVVGSFVVTYNGSTPAPTAAGTYTLEAVFTSDDPDYQGGSASNTITINPTKLKVVVDNNVMQVGNNPPVFTGTVTDLVSGDNVTANYSTTATSASSVGIYPITATLSGSAAGNYSLQVTNGSLYVVTVGADTAGSGGESITFWDNSGNKVKVSAKDLQNLDQLNLVDASGSAFDPTSAAQLQAWLQSAAANNIGYWLSAQLAAMELNVLTGYVSANAVVYAGQLVQYDTLTNPILGLDSGGFITVGNLLAAASAALSTTGVGGSSSFWQGYDQALAQVLQAANSNSSFVQQSVPAGS